MDPIDKLKYQAFADWTYWLESCLRDFSVRETAVYLGHLPLFCYGANTNQAM